MTRTELACANGPFPSLRFQRKQTSGCVSAVNLLDVSVSSIFRPTICQPRLGASATTASVTTAAGDTSLSQPTDADVPWESALPCDTRRSKIIDAKWLAAA